MRKTETVCDRCNVVINGSVVRGNAGTAFLQGFGAGKSFDLCEQCYNAVLSACMGAGLVLGPETDYPPFDVKTRPPFESAAPDDESEPEF